MQDRTDTPAAALWCAAYSGDSDLISHLIGEGVDVNVWDPWGRSGLTFAAIAGHLTIARMLIEAGAWTDPHEDYDVHLTPLMCAAENGRADIVEYLLDKGADPTRHGGTAQITAENYARQEFPELAARLLKAEDEWRRTHSSA